MAFYQKPSVQTGVLVAILAGSHAYTLLTGGSLAGILSGAFFDLAFLFLLSQLFLFLYAQFVLPVRRVADRGEIYRRLVLHSRGTRGPVIFIRNGRILERRMKGSPRKPGLLWLDSASAALTRSQDGRQRALGPGVHFIRPDERVASTFSLHTQNCFLGPTPQDPIFDILPQDASAEEQRQYGAIQAKRTAVAARTRDGNEVVPEINVVFKLDAMPAGTGMPGSRFGYFQGALERAARGEGVAAGPDTDGHAHVAWNQLPGLIAVDLWREYLSKFTLDELFRPGFPAVPEILQPETPLPMSPASAASPSGKGSAGRLLHRLNDALERELDRQGIMEESPQEGPLRRRQAAGPRISAAQTRTALQIVAHMMKERMTKSVVPVLDDCGRLLKGHAPSEEFERLRERGLAVLDVRINSVRFDPAVEDQIVEHWNTGWMSTATGDRRRVEQLELLAAQAGKQRGLLEHADALGKAIQSSQPVTALMAVLSLVRSSHNEVLTDERLQGRGGSELETLAEILRWAEAGGHE